MNECMDEWINEFMDYLTTLSVFQNLQRLLVGLLTKDELERREME
jgi:hypothetical protein